MVDNLSIDDILSRDGWIMECMVPLEIRHEESGSFANGKAAEMIIAMLEKKEEPFDSRITNEALMKKLNEFEGKLADDSFKATMVASDFLGYIQETDNVIPLNKEDVHGSVGFLQGFFDYMAEKINTYNLVSEGSKLTLVKSEDKDAPTTEE